MNWAIYLVIALVVFALILLSQAIIVVQQANRYVIERLGKYHKSLNAGIQIVVPFVDRITKKVSSLYFLFCFAW